MARRGARAARAARGAATGREDEMKGEHVARREGTGDKAKAGEGIVAGTVVALRLSRNIDYKLGEIRRRRVQYLLCDRWQFQL